MAKLVLFGTQKMAQLADFYFTHDSPHSVVAFTVDEKHLRAREFNGRPVVPFEEVERLYPPGEYQIFVAIGYSGLNRIREKKFKEAHQKGYRCASFVCSKSTLWGDTRIGENSFLFENQVIQPFVSIGDNVILWSGNHLGHDVVIQDHCFVASHAVISGGVTIGSNSFIGINATLRDHISIGKRCIIGAGALVLHDVKHGEVYVGRPADRYRLDSDHFEKMTAISR